MYTLKDKLGRFDHHPDPAIDFCIEVEILQGQLFDAEHDMIPFDGLPKRAAKAMDFRVGGDEIAVNAKAQLRVIDDKLRQRFPDMYK